MELVIIQNSRKNPNTIIVMVDRKYKSGFWSEDSYNKAKIFFDYIDANKALSKLKYNNPRIVSLSEAKQLIHNQNIKNIEVELPTFKEKRFSLGGLNYPDTLSNRLEYKVNCEWHDDDWYEGIND